MSRFLTHALTRTLSGLLLLAGGATAAGVFAPVVLAAAAQQDQDEESAEPPPQRREEVAVLITPHGTIVWRFFAGEAPLHAAYVKELIRRGFYDGTTFHRVIPHFVIQGGDPNSKNQDRADDGFGEGDRRLKAEFSETLHYRPGTVGMARDADPDSGSCQFFIALENIPRLDGNYTIFGEVFEGLDVARKIASLPRDLNDNPLERVSVTARIEERIVEGSPLSLQGGESGEKITGPGRRPRFLDPGNVLWAAPERIEGGDAGGERARGRLELTADTDGSVIDVRFPAVQTYGAAVLRERALAWRFKPVTYAGEPALVRFEIDSDGGGIGPVSGGGAPVEAGARAEAGSGGTFPVAAVRVDLDPGRKAPAKATRLRLTIDGAGQVTDASVQAGCGEEALDRAASEAAKKMLFSPVVTGTNPDGSPKTQAVYLNVEARFVESAAD
jgi:peptidyl-prolyl cis-trans isomerase B (cyclophilin B)